VSGADPERRIALAVGAVLVASLALSLWLTDVNQPWAFFSLPTRAWELAIGASLAIGAARLARLPGALASGAVWLGLGLILVGALVLDTATPFPGTAALLPAVGAALVVAGGLGPGSTSGGRLLATGPMRWLGRISYSLYLWHWPIIVLPRPPRHGAPRGQPGLAVCRSPTPPRASADRAVCHGASRGFLARRWRSPAASALWSGGLSPSALAGVRSVWTPA
jgi:peptidoglycan/LPS O-acetylase OafA/YrhL